MLKINTRIKDSRKSKTQFITKCDVSDILETELSRCRAAYISDQMYIYLYVFKDVDIRM